MKLISLFVFIAIVACLNAIQLSKEEIAGKQLELMDETICVDCFERRVAQGATYWDVFFFQLELMDETICVDCFERRVAQGETYWDGCNFCTCDRSVALNARCRYAGCYFSPCPRVKAEIQDQKEHTKRKARDWAWSRGEYRRK